MEKSLGLSYNECQELVDLARSENCFLMENMWTRCFPAIRHVEDLLKHGAIGRPVTVQGDFGWSTKDKIDDRDDRIWRPESGGMILDIVMYMAQFGQVAYTSNSKVENSQEWVWNGVDHTAAANYMYRFGGNNKENTGFLQFYATGEANTEECVVIEGTDGRIVVESPAYVPQHIRIEVDCGRGKTKVQTFDFPLPDDSLTNWNYSGSIGFTHAIQIASDCFRKGLLECPYNTWRDSLQVAAMLDVILDQVQKSANHSAKQKVYAVNGNNLETLDDELVTIA